MISGKLWPQNFLPHETSTTPWGAEDGKHLVIRYPKNGGSFYFDYKGFNSIILFAYVDANYKFMWVDVGVNGSSSDAQIFNQSELWSGIINGTLQVQPVEPLPSEDYPMPYFLIGDDAFSHHTWLMNPFSVCGLPDDQRIFNYRLPCANQVVENVFSIMANIFGCFLHYYESKYRHCHFSCIGLLCTA